MSRTLTLFCISIFASAVFAGPTSAQNSQSGRAVLPFRVAGAEAPLVLGQDEPARKPGFFERMKQTISNWAKDDEYENEYGHSMQNESQPPPVSPASPVSVPTRPPKPVTATEVRKAVDNPDQPVTERRTPTTTRHTPAATEQPVVAKEKPRNVSRPQNNPTEVVAEPEADVPQEDTIFERLKQIREQVFDKQALDESMLQAEPPTAPAATRRAPVPAVPNEVTLYDAAPVRQTPTPRTPPPRTVIDESPRTARNSVVVVDPIEETAAEPTPGRTHRSRTSSSARRPEARQEDQWEAQELTDYVPERSRSERNRSAIVTETTVTNQVTRLEDESDENVFRQHRTAPLSSIGVRQNTASSQVRERPIRERQEPTRVASRSTERDNGEYPIAARRMLPEQDEIRSEEGDSPYPLDSFASIETTPVAAPTSAAKLEKAVLVSPRLEVETESDPRAIVGQEALYRIRIHNRGGAPAEQVVLSVEIPDWIEIRQPDVSAGTTTIVSRTDTKEVRDFNWKISRIEAGGESLLVLRLVPQQRKSIDLKIRYDFFKPTTVTRMVVQEPVLEMELDGPGEVLWGTRVGYRLLVRNVGNGDAENVQLELLQTGSDMKSCELPLLKAGEEQVIDVDVWTGKQENIDINIQATGKYDLSATVSKRVKVKRPNVVMTIDAPAVQFVGSPAEFVIKVRNVGSAEAKDIELAATLPLGARFRSCSDGGEPGSKNQVVWKIDSIPVGEIFTTTIVCEPEREGACSLEAAVNDKSGVLANCVNTFEAAAIVELKLDVENPQGPIEVGREAIYAVNLANRGTKAAENVEVTVFFGKHLEPYAIEGGTAYTSDGQVVFDKIPTIAPNQRLTLKVKARADDAGSHRIRTEVICGGAEIHLVNEQATYFYKKQKGKSTASSNGNAPIAVAPKTEERIQPTPVVAAKPTPKAAPKPKETPKPKESPKETPAVEKPASPPPLPMIVKPAPTVKEPVAETPSKEPEKKLVDPFLQ